jgi:tetratricopeptide (TPR) repeat protein
VSSALSLEAEMRLALVDTEHDPERRAAWLGGLTRRDAPKPLHVVLLGEAAQASAEAGRFDEALALLDRSAALGPAGALQADTRRGEILGRWIAALATRGDSAGVATVYAAYTTEIEERASREDRLAIARALGALDLHVAAVRVLRRGAGEPVAAGVATALAEEALAAGDIDRARAAAERVLTERPAPELATRAHAVLARAALRADDVDMAATAAMETSDLEPAPRSRARSRAPRRSGARALSCTRSRATRTPPRALLAAASAALGQGAWSVAAETYRRALAVATAGPERAEAAAGLARAAERAGEPAATASALATLAELEDGPDAALVRRLAAAVAPRGERRAR